MRYRNHLITTALFWTLFASRPVLAQEPPHDNPDKSPSAKDGFPLAGWHNGIAYFRDPNDNFRVYVQGRAQVDAYAWAGPGVPDTNLKPTVFLKRVRPEVSGEVLGTFVYFISGELSAGGAVDNADGASIETRAAAPGMAPSATSGRYASGESPRFTAAPADVYVGGKWLDGLLNAQVGQFDANFTMENRTSDKYFPFIERSMAVRAVGIPTNKEIGLMLWGEPKSRIVYYSLGLYNGDGQNRLNLDGSGEVMARVFAHPLATMKKLKGLEDAQFGMSFRYGYREATSTASCGMPSCPVKPSPITYDYPAMTTQGGYRFWNPVYRGDGGVFTHVIPSGDQLGLAWELRIPWRRFDLTSELVYIDNNTREAQEGFQATNTDRLGHIFGTSAYIQLGAWLLGPRDVSGKPGYENFTHVDFSKPDPVEPAQALQLLGRYEMVNLTYHSSNRGNTPSQASNIDGNIVVHGLQLGANYWFTKHIRVSANYEYYLFPDSGPSSGTPANGMNLAGPAWSEANRAQAPGNTLGPNQNVDANTHLDTRNTAHDMHELSLRFGVAL